MITRYAYECRNQNCTEYTRPQFREMPAGDARRPPGDLQICQGCSIPLLYHGPIYTEDAPPAAPPAPPATNR